MSAEAFALAPKVKDRRALNAYRHGLTGHVLIIAPEEQAVYQRHCQGIHESFAPAGAMEIDLVQSIADDRWRLKHGAALESSIFALGISNHPEVDAALSQARVWLDQSHQLALLTLYESRIQRRVEKNIQLLRQLQQDRRAAQNQAIEEANLLFQLAASKGKAYDIEQDFPPEALPGNSVLAFHQFSRLAAHHRCLAEAKTHLRQAA